MRFIDLTGINPATGRPYREQTHVEAFGLTLTCCWTNKGYQDVPGAPKGGCLHWSGIDPVPDAPGATRRVVFDDYRTCVVADEHGKAYLVRMLRWDQKPQATWHRNSYLHPTAIMANPEHATEIPLPEQVSLAALWDAEVFAWKRIDPRGRIMVPALQANEDATVIAELGHDISVATIQDHAGYAALDNYRRWRWDCRWRQPHNGMEVFADYAEQLVRYHDALKDGTRQFEFLPLLEA